MMGKPHKIMKKIFRINLCGFAKIVQSCSIDLKCIDITCYLWTRFLRKGNLWAYGWFVSRCKQELTWWRTKICFKQTKCRNIMKLRMRFNLTITLWWLSYAVEIIVYYLMLTVIITCEIVQLCWIAKFNIIGIKSKCIGLDWKQW